MTKGYLYYEPNENNPARGTIRALAPHRLVQKDCEDAWKFIEMDWKELEELSTKDLNRWYINLEEGRPELTEGQIKPEYLYQELLIRVTDPHYGAAIRFVREGDELVVRFYPTGAVNTNQGVIIPVLIHEKGNPLIPIATFTVDLDALADRGEIHTGIILDRPIDLLVKGPHFDYSLEY